MELKRKRKWNENDVKGLIQDINDFINGKRPKSLKVFKIDKDGNEIEIIN